MEKISMTDEQRRAKNTEKNRIWRKKNPEKVNVIQKRWRDNARLFRPDIYQAYIRNRNDKQFNRLRRKQFGTDGADLYIEQNGLCKICSREMMKYAGGKLLGSVLDHDHKTNRVRGWLCRACNLAVGLFDDDLERMARAIEYVRNHGWLPAKNV